MPAIPNLEAANNRGYLWPSVSDAVDTFLRRRHNNANPYERVWRLIHLWEATEITLALACMSRLIGDSAEVGILRRQREFFYGKTWDVSLDEFKSIPGAKDGTVDQWINILDEIAKLAEPSSRFLAAVKAFLVTSEIDAAPLLNAWAKACDVPPDYRRDKVEVRTAMRYVNSFRNRLAHVPFPHDPLGEVADALEASTEQLFSIAPLPTVHEKGGQSSALTGAFRFGRCFLHGGQMESLADGQFDEIQFVFPCRQRGDDNEVWQAKPMLHLDSMMRPHILTRVKGHDVCEYTRFRAEANAVLVQVNGGIVQRLPVPVKSDYVTKAEEPTASGQSASSLPKKPDQASAPATNRELTMSEAIDAIRSEEYDPAIEFFTKQTQAKPHYHIGWLRLGYARREKAVRVAPDDPKYGVALLKLAVQDLAKAAQHADVAYQASALYERSKALYHLDRLEPEIQEHRKKCLIDAEKAYSLSDEKKFLTWLEYVQRGAIAQSV